MNRTDFSVCHSAQPADAARLERKRYFLYYTICFSAACLVVFCWFLASNTTLIWKTDGENQHFKALVYYGQYLRSIVKNLVAKHRLIIPNWEFSLGEGNDVLGTLHYYVIGDPFAALSVLVPVKYMYLFYNAMMIVRLYLAGAAFSGLCLYTGQKNTYAVLSGAMTYVFCYWGLLCAAKHPYFLNPMIYLPLLIMGVEKILDKKRPYLLIWSVFLSAVSNFYFFYILAMLTALYTIARLVYCFHNQPKVLFGMLVFLTACSLVGVILAAFMLLPVLFIFLSDARMSAGSSWPLLYPAVYYSRLPALFFIPDSNYWLCMGYSIPTFPALCMLVRRRKEHGFLLLLALICLIIAVFPVLGKFLSAFSLIGNRYSFAIALVAAYILTAMWNSFTDLNTQDGIFLFSVTGVYLAVCLLLNGSRSKTIVLFCVLALFLTVILFPGTKDGEPLFSYTRIQQITFGFVLLSIFCSSYLKYSVQDYVSEHVKADEVNQRLEINETAAVKQAAETENVNGFYRYSGRGLTSNAGLTAGLSSTRYYWSLSNSAVSDYRKAMTMREYIQYNYMGYDDRAALLSLSSVRYYTAPPKNPDFPPFGFSYLDTVRMEHASAYHVYRNDYVLPLAYTYDSYISKNTWDTLSPLKKQEAMLQAAVLDKETASDPYLEKIPEEMPRFTEQKLSYRMTCHGNVSLQDNAFTVSSEYASVTLNFDGLKNSETYLYFQGLDFEASDPETIKTDLKLTPSVGVSKKLEYYSAKDPRRYNDRHDFTVCFGYSNEAVTSVTIHFSAAGTYFFDTLEVLCQPMEDYPAQIGKLKEDVLNQVTIGTDTVTGSISLSRPKILCLSIPYSSGWHARVDGKEAALYPVNLKNMALFLTAGEHNVALYYETPLQKAGFLISLCGICIFGVLYVLTERKYRKEDRNDDI